jgi:hypothetical protein
MVTSAASWTASMLPADAATEACVTVTMFCPSRKTDEVEVVVG